MKTMLTCIRDWTSRARMTLTWNPASLLPVLVTALFLWWFCQVPNYALPSLPYTWTPGCPEWTAAWHTVPLTQQQGRVVMHLIKPKGEAQSDIYAEEFQTGGNRIFRFDALTGKTLATSAVYPSSARITRLKGNLLRLHDFVAPGKQPSIYWLDRETLIERRALQLDIPIPTGSNPWRSLFSGIRELPSGEIVGIYGIEAQGRSWEQSWFRADRTGKLLENHAVGGEGAMFTPWPDEAPEVMFSWIDWMGSNVVCIDLETGQPTDLPPALASRPGNNNGVRVPRRRGWVNLPRNNIGRSRRIEVECLANHPFVFQRQHSRHPDESPDLPIDLADQCARSFALVRHAVWRQLWSDDYIEARGDRAYRIEGLLVQGGVTNLSPRILAGDLLESLRTQPLVDSDLRARIAESLGQPVRPRSPSDVISLDPGMEIREWRNGHLLISQVLTRFPEQLSLAPAIWRVGLLEAGSTTVEWLGWLPLPTYADSNTVPRLEVLQDQLLIHQPGIFYTYPNGKTVTNRPFSWMLLPLPPALANLPEGPLQ